jgi:hypothetical protein
MVWFRAITFLPMYCFVVDSLSGLMLAYADFLPPGACCDPIFDKLNGPLAFSPWHLAGRLTMHAKDALNPHG